MGASYVQGRVIGAMRGIEGHAYFCSPFCILKPATSHPWTCCSSGACLRGARSCLAILHQGQSSQGHFCSSHASYPPATSKAPPVSLPPLLIVFSYNAQNVDPWVREEALDCLSRIFSGSQWRNWGRGKGKAHHPETDSRQRGDQHLESWRMFGEENAAVGPRAAS